MASAQLGDTLRQMQRLFGEGTLVGLADAQLLARFLDHRDESAFAALVQRHGPMVLGTCRAVLKDPDDAEDAFQASFLILVKKARSIERGGSLGGWLHRVAHRVAVQANSESARRRARERTAGAMLDASRRAGPPADDLRPALHDEIQRLPERYRLPVVLCDLEGLTRDEAAGRLRWTEGTVRGRLARARRLLKSRLVRRGMAPGAVLMVGGRTGQAAVPEALAATTLRAACQLATAGGAVSAEVAALVAAVTRTMAVAKLKGLAAFALSLSAMLALGAVALRAEDEPPPARGQAAPAPAPAPTPPLADPDPAGTVVFRGRVLGPDGRGFQGARLYLLTPLVKPSPRAIVRAESDADGRFRFAVARGDMDQYWRPEPWRKAPVLGVAEGLGAGMSSRGGPDDELTVRLVEDDVPITGRVLDLQGRPVPGARVRVLAVKACAGDDLSPWHDALLARKSAYDVESEFLVREWYVPDGFPALQPVVTGADGRFRIDGIGRERLASLVIDGPAIESGYLNAMTRPGPTVRVPSYASPTAEADVTYVGARFDHVAGPSRPVEGFVRDRATGKPLAGVAVQGDNDLGGSPIERVRTTTDSRGHYRLTGLPKGREGQVLAQPADDSPYLTLFQRVPKGAGDGDEPARLDFALKRGVRVTGRVVDRATGRPLKANVEYFVFTDNPHRGGSDFSFSQWTDDRRRKTSADGTFGLTVLPGPGVIAARAFDEHYLMGVGAEALPDEDGNGILDTHPYGAIPTNYHAVALVDPAPGAEAATCNLALDPGRSLKGSILGPDGRPLSGARVSGLYDMKYWEHEPLAGAEFTMTGLRPDTPRFLEFLHPVKQLAGWLVVPAGEATAPTVTLRPWGVVTGRLVDDDGQPRTRDQLVFSGGRKGGPLYGSLPGNGSGMSGRIVPASDGRFRIEGLAPDLPYSLELEVGPGRRDGWVIRDLVVKPGETRDLGDVQARPEPDKRPPG